MEKLWEGKRICDYCGVNIDYDDIDVLYEIHGNCWQKYRADGKIYPMPGKV